MNYLSKIKKYFRFYTNVFHATEDVVKLTETRLYTKMKRDELHRLAMKTTELGVSGIIATKNPVIISLTTFGKRLYEVYLTIFSSPGSFSKSFPIIVLNAV